jgi:hypothetical protein
MTVTTSAASVAMTDSVEKGSAARVMKTASVASAMATGAKVSGVTIETAVVIVAGAVIAIFEVMIAAATMAVAAEAIAAFRTMVAADTTVVAA